MSLQNLPGEGNQGEPLRQEAQGAPAAPEYPIRALVRADAKQEIWPHMPKRGSEIRIMRPSAKSGAYWCSEGFIWDASSLDILPADGGEAAPEASEGSPSLPSAPMDLRERLAKHCFYAERPTWDSHEWEDRTHPQFRAAYFAKADAILAVLTPDALPAPTVPKGGVDLVEALRKYGSHIRGPEICESLKHSEYPCTCGLDEILAKLEGR